MNWNNSMQWARFLGERNFTDERNDHEHMTFNQRRFRRSIDNVTLQGIGEHTILIAWSEDKLQLRRWQITTNYLQPLTDRRLCDAWHDCMPRLEQTSRQVIVVKWVAAESNFLRTDQPDEMASIRPIWMNCETQRGRCWVRSFTASDYSAGNI